METFFSVLSCPFLLSWSFATVTPIGVTIFLLGISLLISSSRTYVAIDNCDGRVSGVFQGLGLLVLTSMFFLLSGVFSIFVFETIKNVEIPIWKKIFFGLIPLLIGIRAGLYAAKEGDWSNFSGGLFSKLYVIAEDVINVFLILLVFMVVWAISFFFFYLPFEKYWLPVSLFFVEKSLAVAIWWKIIFCLVAFVAFLVFIGGWCSSLEFTDLSSLEGWITLGGKIVFDIPISIVLLILSMAILWFSFFFASYYAITFWRVVLAIIFLALVIRFVIIPIASSGGGGGGFGDSSGSSDSGDNGGWFS